MAESSENTSWNGKFWTKRYHDEQTGWDMGQVSPPLKAYADQLSRRDLRVLIPGAGNAYEAEYLHQSGFTSVTVVDLSPLPLQNLKKRCPDFPDEQLVLGDFFALEPGYDLVLEQTFFCALDPKLRKAYVKKMHQLLVPGGKLVGVLFDIPLNADHPPFGGSREQYQRLFAPYFEFKDWDTCYNSIPPRADNELWINLQKGEG